MKELSKQELADILDNVTAEVTTLVKTEKAKTEEALVKADPGEETPGEEMADGSSTEDSAVEAPGTDAPADIPPAAEETAPEAPAAPAPEAPAVAAEESAPAEDHADPAVEEGVTPEVLQGEYAKLPPEELKAHLMAAQAAYMATMGGVEEAAPEAPVAPAAPAPAPAPEETMKAEMDSEGNGGDVKAGNAVEKSEAPAEDPAFVELKKSLAKKEEEMNEIKATVQTLTDVLSKTLNRPMRKSVTDISDVGFSAKPGSENEASAEEEDLSKLSRNEVMVRLNEISAGALEKSDRDLINRFCIKDVDVTSIAHLLKK